MYEKPEPHGRLEYKKIKLHSAEESIAVQSKLVKDLGFTWSEYKDCILDLKPGSTIYLGSALTKVIYLESQIQEKERIKFDFILSTEI